MFPEGSVILRPSCIVLAKFTKSQWSARYQCLLRPGKHRTRCRHESTDIKPNTYSVFFQPVYRPHSPLVAIPPLVRCPPTPTFFTSWLPPYSRPPSRALTAIDDFPQTAPQNKLRHPQHTPHHISRHAAATDSETAPCEYTRARYAERSAVLPKRDNADRADEHNHHRTFRAPVPSRPAF